MNKSVESFRLVMLLWLSFATAANANPRLDKAQRAYFVEVDAFVAKEVSALFNKHALLLKEIVQKSLSASSQRASSIEDSILTTLEATTLTPSYIDLIAQELRVNQALWAISDSEQESKRHFEKLQETISRFNKEQLCDAVVQETSSARAPKYTLDEYIDLSYIPLPKFFSMQPAPGSEVPSADAIEKGLYLPATQAGCAAGQALLPFLPVVGCLVGVAAGAAISYGAGKAATAIITNSENQAELDAHQRAADAERKRQEVEIAEAKIWMKEHPLTNDVVVSRARAFCLAQPDFSTESLVNEAKSWLDAATKTKEKVERHAKSLSEKHDLLRAKTIRDARGNNEILVKDFYQSLTDNKSQSDKENELKQLKRDFAACLLGEGDSCTGIASCIEESQTALDILGPNSDNFQEELQSLRDEVAQCNNAQRKS